MRISIHNKIANYIKNSPRIQKGLLSVEKNPAMVNSLMCASVGIIAKPVTMLMLPEKDKEMKKDNRYALARALSTGVLDFIFALAIFIPLNKKIDSHGKKLFNTKNTIYYQNKEMVTNAKSMINRGFRFATLPIFAVCKFSVIPPTLKLLFKKNESKKND